MSKLINTANLVDVHIGGRIGALREGRGLARQDLARLLEVSEEQIEAIERGSRRAGAGDLYELARLFDVKVAYFFDLAAVGGPIGEAGFEEPAALFGAPDRATLAAVLPT